MTRVVLVMAAFTNDVERDWQSPVALAAIAAAALRGFQAVIDRTTSVRQGGPFGTYSPQLAGGPSARDLQ